VQTTEKNPRAIELISKGTSGHASRPLESNAIVRLAAAIEKIGNWQPPITLNETTGTYFRRLTQISPPAKAQVYRDVLDPQKAAAADRYLKTNEPAHSAMLHLTLSPTLVQAGIRINVIPSDAKATIDLRIMPDEDPASVLEMVKKVVNDPAVTVQYAPRDVRPVGISRLDTEAYRAIEAAVMKTYNTPTLPIMGTGATDMSYLRGKGIQCYGIGVGRDAEDVALGFAQHSDQERILENELYKFVRFHWELVDSIARSR
jgi:acetylornithine deacetylase/succinyl-diaminopimelate desuccinylase-like protein